MHRAFLLASSVLLCLPIAAQEAAPGKRALTHDDYDTWNSLRGTAIQRQGNFVAFAITPREGDSVLLIRSTDGAVTYRVERGTSPRFSHDGRYVVFQVQPSHAEKKAYAIEQVRKGRSSGSGPRSSTRGSRGRGRFGSGSSSASSGSTSDGAPKAHYEILDVTDGSRKKLEKVRGYRLSSESPSVLLIHEEKPKPEKPEKKEGEEGAEKKVEGAPAKEGEKGEKAEPKPTEGTKKSEGETKAEEGGAKPSAEGAPAEKKAEPETKGETTESGEKEKAAEPRGERRERRRGGSGRPPQEPKGEAQEEEGSEKGEGKKDEEKPKPKKYHTDGSPLVVRYLERDEELRIEGVTSYGTSGKGALLWYVQNSAKDDPKIERGLYVMDLETKERKRIVSGAANFSSLTFDREGRRLVFASNRRDRDTEKDSVYDIYGWNRGDQEAQVLVLGKDANRALSEMRITASPRFDFSRNGQAMTFRLEPQPEEEMPKILPEDKVTLDIWHYKDEMLQPMQALRRRSVDGSVTCAYHFDTNTYTPLTREEGERLRFLTEDGSRALATVSEHYGRYVSWDQGYSDVYVVNTLDGSRKPILKMTSASVSNSPSGRYLLYFESPHWWSYDLATHRRVNLTDGADFSFASETEDRPQDAGAYGTAGWTEDERYVVLYDRFDLWKFAVDDSAEPECITDRMGRTGQLRLRYTSLDREERYLPEKEPMLLSAFDEDTMASGYYRDSLFGIQKPVKVVMRNAAFRSLQKAEEADRLFYNVSTWERYPDLYTADLNFASERQLSEANPQQDDYRWGNAELVEWHSADGVPLKGILVKPEGFDPKKKYPMMVYFYERNSHRLHSYTAPAAGTSPNAAYYVSNGYLWFVPDIVYTVGYPGESALKCIVAGVQKLIEQGFVDEKAIGAAGHSWGGYQTAYLVTRTNIFAAVESGAPVSNMTSAYGGIRWGSGMSRAFQYEKTQSRIGGSLWDHPMRYLENSPIFAADRVETPVLMLHNDEDGAVPWYQGIEYFCALRRLGKEVYMFNYNGQGHGLSREADQMDWTIRMQQYFDHHLRGHEMPEWMAHGVAYADREREKLRFRPEIAIPPEEKKEEGEPATPPEINEPAAEATTAGSSEGLVIVEAQASGGGSL